MRLTLADDSINDLVRDGMKEAIKMAKRSHFTDIWFRIGSEDVRMEADWIKHLEIESE